MDLGEAKARMNIMYMIRSMVRGREKINKNRLVIKKIQKWCESIHGFFRWFIFFNFISSLLCSITLRILPLYELMDIIYLK